MCVGKEIFRSASQGSEWILTYHHQVFDEKTIVCTPVEREFVGLYFNVGSQHRYCIGNGKSRIIYSNQFNLVYLPPESALVTISAGDYSAICIQFTKGYLSQFANDFGMLASFLANIELQEPAFISEFNLVAMPVIIASLQEIKNDSVKFADLAGQVMLQSRIMSILTSCLRHVQHQSRSKIQRSDVKKIAKAHEYLINNISSPITIGLLADMVEMDVRKFEKAFKVIYGTTAYNFLVDLRLQKAVDLLTETHLLTKEIAHLVGYKESKKFSEAFKKKFGYSPSNVRKWGTITPSNVKSL